MALHAFDNDNRVVYHQADGEYQPEHRKRVDGETEERKEDKGSNQGNRHRQQWNHRGAPVLQKEIDHQDHEDDCDHECPRISFMPSVTGAVWSRDMA